MGNGSYFLSKCVPLLISRLLIAGSSRFSAAMCINHGIWV